MAEQVTSYIVENDKAFQAALKRLAASTNDFRIPFGLIAKEFYRSNKKIFSLKSAGLYPDYGGFRPNSKVMFKGRLVTRKLKAKFLKKKAVGFVYPMLVRSGKLASSLLNPSDPETVKIITRKSLVLGSDVDYLKYHQSDKPRKVLPQRKAVFIDGGPLESSKGAKISGRRQTWLNIINQYILDNIEEVKF
jgi:hypothetical protein